MPKTILLIGTFDTKQDELAFIGKVIDEQGGRLLTMDVSVLGDASVPASYSKHDVAAAAEATIADVRAAGAEAEAFAIMSRGAALLAARLHAEGRFDGMIALGGTMGTDLALDVALALPLGVPKYIVSTVAFSALIPPERIAPDVQMILWAGGLYGLNSICRSVLAQAAGAVLGAARAATGIARETPLIGITSLGKSCLKYMEYLMPELEKRGYEAAFFHSTGMGGRAFETLAGQGHFAAVLDFCLQEFGNGLQGSIIASGPDRLQSAGRAGVPQIVAPGTVDLVDIPTWQVIPERFSGRPLHVHNKLVSSLTLNAEERRHAARAIATRLNEATGPTHIVLPLGGVQEWDREGQFGHDRKALDAFFDEIRGAIRPPVTLSETPAHINDPGFCAAALAVFDDWVADGIISPTDKARTHA